MWAYCWCCRNKTKASLLCGFSSLPNSAVADFTFGFNILSNIWNAIKLSKRYVFVWPLCCCYIGLDIPYRLFPYPSSSCFPELVCVTCHSSDSFTLLSGIFISQVTVGFLSKWPFPEMLFVPLGSFHFQIVFIFSSVLMVTPSTELVRAICMLFCLYALWRLLALEVLFHIEMTECIFQ